MNISIHSKLLISKLSISLFRRKRRDKSNNRVEHFKQQNGKFAKKIGEVCFYPLWWNTLFRLVRPLIFIFPFVAYADLSKSQLSTIDEIQLEMQRNLSPDSSENKKSDTAEVKKATIIKKEYKLKVTPVIKEKKKPIDKKLPKKKLTKTLIVSYCLDGSYEKLALRAKKYQSYITEYSQKYDISESLIKAIITAESCFNRHAESPKGAQGLMQLMPDTAKRFDVKDSFDPDSNIKGGTRYLKFLFDYYDEDLLNVIAAYNAGEGAVDKYKGIPPFKETRVYVSKVASLYKLYTKGGGQLSSGTVAASNNKELKESIFIPRAMPKSRLSPYKGIVKNITRGQCADRTSERLKKWTQIEGGDGVWQRIYIAGRGDTLTHVMQRTGIHKSKVAQMNGLRSRVKLKEGQKVLVWECRK